MKPIFRVALVSLSKCGLLTDDAFLHTYWQLYTKKTACIGDTAPNCFPLRQQDSRMVIVSSSNLLDCCKKSQFNSDSDLIWTRVLTEERSKV